MQRRRDVTCDETCPLTYRDWHQLQVAQSPPCPLSMLSPKPKKKPYPACDSCKAKRVLCHSKSDGPCPRCVEKGILCKTTYIQRGRPKKAGSPTIDALQTTVPQSLGAPVDSLLTPELTKHLFKLFNDLPHRRHPILHRIEFEKLIVSASWRIDLLHPQAAVLATCICCVAASVSWHSSIIGPGPHPESLADATVIYPGADLRSYGERRAPVYQALQERAITMACTARVMLEPSDMNAASCMLLELSEEDIENSSRPWASAYLSHLRAISAQWEDREPGHAFWTGYLAAEALRAALNRKPVVVTLADQFSFMGNAPMALESYLAVMQQQPQESPTSIAVAPITRFRTVFNCMIPLLFHMTCAARDFYEQIAGDFARRSAPSEPEIVKLLNTLSTMQTILSRCFSGINFPEAAAINHNLSQAELRSRAETFPELRSVAFLLTVIFTGLALSLYRELEHRAASDAAMLALQPDAPQTAKWAQMRVAVIREQARELVLSALPDVHRVLVLQNFPLSAISVSWSNVAAWGDFIADEADAAGGLLEGHVAVCERIMNELKRAGYSQINCRFDTTIARLDAHLSAYKLIKALPAVESLLEAPDTVMSDMSFLLDGSWMVATTRL
ncbi:Zn(2)-C6 fungal-type transcriptional factor [Mycena chlorophos]|uniref:Zn(2)-C6 fungal-type transcriptional factor n=1 Tax=Mycena chlorophos TaxID=658473 RepID=A0A8H6S1H1_MYCCL|nr:Zn(2)-C6 fungal-type transcriptional factor [Mycena chlorophos]